MFFTEAYAQAAGATATGSSPIDMLLSIAPFLLIFVVMYFLIIRPQRAQMKRRDEMISNVRRGDQVVLGGGIIGKVSKIVDEKEVEVEIADGVKVRVVRAQITDVRVKGEPVAQ